MKAVLMAGGEGSRLRPLTIGRPKPTVPVVNKTVMDHILALLKSHGITEVVVTVRYMANAIQDTFEDGRNLGMHLTYVVEEQPLGTAGSVRNAARYLDDTFLVLSADALTDFDLTQIVAAHRERGAHATLTLTHVPNPLEYGVINTAEDGRITQFLEKPSWSEVTSDTVNTGIYVLEPEVLDLIPDDAAYDFSNELFPRMLALRKPLFGYIAEGYWCDVGNIEEYRRANSDVLYGRLKLTSPIGHHVGGGIWVGDDVQIAPSAQLFGPIYLGHGVKIKGNVTIYGPSVIRDYTVIDSYSRIERSILWRNNYVGENCELRGAIVARQCSIKSHVMVYEGAVIGDNCVVGEGSSIHADVKLWPHKEIEAGATVKDSIIWGNQARRALFGRFGVTGVVNVDLTPEFAAKLGAALGASLPKGSYVALNRDTHRSSRMLKRALISGVPGTGINVWDLGNVPVPVVRYFVRTRKDTTAGVHVRLSPFDQRVVDIRFIDHRGMNQSKADERTVERIFFREDFRRAYLDEIGTIQYAMHPIQDYIEGFLRHIDVEKIRAANFSVVIDYSHGLAIDTLAQILGRLGVDVVPLNARMDETKLAMLEHEFTANRERVAKIVVALKANLGIQLDVGGDKLFLVDDQGIVLDDLTAAALMFDLALCAEPGQRAAAPINLPSCFDTIAANHKAELVRIGGSLYALQQGAEDLGILIMADGTGNFIFPAFQPAVDGIMAAVRLLQYLAVRNEPMSEIVRKLPKSYVAADRVNCPAEAKGLVMRKLNEEYAGCDIDVTDGIKLFLTPAEWIHIAPDADYPYFSLTAEAGSQERSLQIIHEFDAKINSYLGQAA